MKAIDLFEDGRLAGLTPNGKLLLVYLHLLAEEAGTPTDALAFLSEGDVYDALHLDCMHDAVCAIAECAKHLNAQSGKNRQTAPLPPLPPPCPPAFPALPPTPPISPLSPPYSPPTSSPTPACARAIVRPEKPENASTKSGNRYTYSEQFEAWWKAYPGTRKDSKNRAYAKWKTLVERGLVTMRDLFVGLLGWINSDEWQKEGGQYICAPLVWLNKERWMADPKPGRLVQNAIAIPAGETVTYEQPAAKEPEYDAHLQRFLQAYPKGAGDFDRLLFAWDTVTKALDVRPDDLVRAVALAANSKQWKDDDGRYIPRPERWLEDKGWYPYVMRFKEERKKLEDEREARRLREEEARFMEENGLC